MVSEFYLDRPFQYRPNTSDRIVIEEVYVKNCYQFPNCTGLVVDIGGNIGSFTCLAAKTAKKVLTFEPETHNYGLLEKNTSGLKNVELFQVAVGAPGEAEIQDLQGGSHISFTGSPLDMSQKVKVISINDIITEPVDFLKVDCEGSEYDIFDHATGEVMSLIRQVVIEFHPWSQERHNVTFARLIEFFDFELLPGGLWKGTKK